jgi:hypothetical protein
MRFEEEVHAGLHEKKASSSQRKTKFLKATATQGELL